MKVYPVPENDIDNFIQSLRSDAEEINSPVNRGSRLHPDQNFGEVFSNSFEHTLIQEL